MRSTAVAYILWLFFGLIGVHRFYCGRVGTGILWFFTGGVFGIGWLVDVFLIPDMVEEANREYLSLQRNHGPWAVPQRPRPPGAPYPPPAPATPMPVDQDVSGIAHGYRVVFCTQCGGPMQVPEHAAGSAYACPACQTVLQIPA